MLMIICKATHPPVGDLGSTSGRLRHHREASWEVARHNSHLVGLQLGPLSLTCDIAEDDSIFYIKSKSGRSQFHLRLFKELCVYVVKLLPKTECPSNMKTSMSNNISGLYRRAHKLYLNFYAKLFLWCLHLQSFQLLKRHASPHLVWLPNTQPTCCCE